MYTPMYVCVYVCAHLYVPKHVQYDIHELSLQFLWET